MNSWNCYKLLKLPSNGLISGNISKKPWVWPSNTGFTINFRFNHPTSAQSYHRCLVRFRTWSAGVPMWRNPKARPLDMPVLLLSPCCRSGELRNEGTHIWHTLPPKSNLMVDQHVFHENCVELVCLICWANPHVNSLFCYLDDLTWLFLLVNVPILRKLSNLLSGQWTSLHCNFASFRLALRLSPCPGNMDFGTHRRLTKKPMPLGTPVQIGLPRSLTNQSEDGIWISRTGLYPKIPIAMVKMGS